MRICNSCGFPKGLDDFYKTKSKVISECKDCFKERMGTRHQKHKLILVAEAGGRCERCGYDREPRILNFHHRNPETKEFGIARRLSANIEILRVEAAKCFLLCPNCHQEHHLGVA